MEAIADDVELSKFEAPNEFGPLMDEFERLHNEGWNKREIQPILGYLGAGGGLIVVGGIAFHTPDIGPASLAVGAMLGSVCGIGYFYLNGRCAEIAERQRQIERHVEARGWRIWCMPTSERPHPVRIYRRNDNSSKDKAHD